MTDDATVFDRAKRNATGIVATTVTGTWLAALMLGADWWLAAMLFGYIVLVPVTAMLFDDEEDREAAEDATLEERTTRNHMDVDDRTDALELIRTRYAKGELTDEEFERTLDRLLETETISDAERWLARTDHDGDHDGDNGKHRRTAIDAQTASSTETESER